MKPLPGLILRGRSTHEADAAYMAAALRLSRRQWGLTWPNPAVASLIVTDGPRGGVIAGRGVTAIGGRPHAEVVALQAAGERARGATCYVTLEPCSHFGRTPPCTDALVASGVGRVVTAAEDPDPRVRGRGHQKLRDAGIEVVTGVLEAEACLAHVGHERRIIDGRPLVTLKLAVSPDGFIANSDRSPVAITGEETRARVHMQRAMHDAVLIGSGTALADDPLLTVRLPGMADHAPVRVVVDRRLRVGLGSALLKSLDQAPVWVVAGQGVAEADVAAIRAAGADVIRSPETEDRLDPAHVLAQLAARGITRLYVEGGQEIATSLLEAGLVDDLIVVAGTANLGDGLPALARGSLDDHLAKAFSPVARDLLGGDVMTTYRRKSDPDTD